MAAFWDWPNARRYGLADRRTKTDSRPGVYVRFVEMLRLWRDRHRRRQELAMMSDADLRDTGVPRDLAAHEACKRPWQSFHPQLQPLEAGARRRSRVSRHQGR
jgi:uncharacterized protein YjiS (DUF1127 family)